jgi:F-box and WD-40 domain protein 1/11
VYCLQSSGRWMITGSRDRTVRLWRLAEIDEHGAIGETELLCVVSDAHGGSVLSLDFEVEAEDEDGKGRGKMITGSSDTTAGVWRINWGDNGPGPLPRESHLASGTGDSKQKQGNVDQPSVERIGTLRGHTGGVLDVLMGTRHYVTCSKDATIRIYDRDDYHFLRSIAAHEGPVNCLARNPNREVEQVVSASGDGTWVIWDLETGEAVRNGGGDGRGLACVVWEVSAAICLMKGSRGDDANGCDIAGRLHRYGRQ